MKVFKYNISPKTELPKGAQVLRVDVQIGLPVMWCLVDPSAELEVRSFQIVGTGWDVPEKANYIGTYFEMQGAFVWHVFEVLIEK